MDVLNYLLPLIPLAIAAALIYRYVKRVSGGENTAQTALVKLDWVPTGRIDFALQHEAPASDADQPSEFKLLVEERRIVESIAGNENLEIQWRLATLAEAKLVIAQYHKFLTDHALIRTVSDVVPLVPA
jgi:hypothetical protein